jgi:hypothetical protein
VKIVTENIRPPVPSRRWDWVAYFDNYDDGDPIAYGATEDEAIVNLMEQHIKEEVKS